MIDEKLRSYIERGVNKGFNIEYLKSTLKKHGHDPLSVDLAARHFQEEQVPVTKVEIRGREDNRNIPLILGLSLIIVVLFAFIAIQSFKQGPTSAAINCEPQVKTVEVCKGLVTKADTQKRLDEIDHLTIEINKKQASIDMQLNRIAALNASVEEKEEIIQNMIGQLREVNQNIKTEREKIKVLLMQLLNAILQG